jgi:hypothetical protein
MRFINLRCAPKSRGAIIGKIVAINIETGAFEVAKDSLTTSDQLLARLTDAQIWFVRIGHRAVHRVGLIGANLFQ